jgi:hypothetical protein
MIFIDQNYDFAPFIITFPYFWGEYPHNGSFRFVGEGIRMHRQYDDV